MTSRHRRIGSGRSRRACIAGILGALAGLLLGGCGDGERAIDQRYRATLALLESEETEDRDEARLAMAALAGFDEMAPQHAGAHRWMGLDLFAQADPRRARASRETLALAGRHLARAIELGTEDEETISTFARILQRTGKPDEAISLLSERIERMPALGVQLAWIHDARGNPEAAAHAASIGAEHWRGVVGSDPENLEARLRWARGRMLGGHYEDAVKIVAEGRSLLPDRRYDAFESALRIRQADAAAAGGPDGVASAIGYLEEAHRLMPGSPAAVNRLAKLSERDEATRTKVYEAMERLVSSGHAGMLVHFALGELEMKAGNLPAAITHFETASEIAPRNPFPSNLLAWCLLHLDPPDPRKAMEVWERTVTLVPGFKENPVGQRTLGAILVKRGRFEEGIAELEKARPLLGGEMLEELEAVLAVALAGAGAGAGAKDIGEPVDSSEAGHRTN